VKFSVVVVAFGLIVTVANASAAGGPLSGATAQYRLHPLFDGSTLDGWTTEDGQRVTRGWTVEEGMIHRASEGGHIVTAAEYADFVLEFEWKIAPGGNSGLKYKVTPYPGKGLLGCEYQILDDQRHKDGRRAKTSTGSLYALYEPGPNKYMHPAGQWNHSRILVWGNHIEHWLNGQLVVSAENNSCDWQCRVGASKFSDTPCFGRNRYGKIMLQDHGADVWFRNIQIGQLEPVQSSVVRVRHIIPRSICRHSHGERRGLFDCRILRGRR
jgi:hypothetical protein